MPTFGLDALSSAAYGPEAALIVLLPLGCGGTEFHPRITVAIVILLGIVYVITGRQSRRLKRQLLPPVWYVKPRTRSGAAGVFFEPEDLL